MSTTDINQVIKDLERWEGAVPWMYLDTRGLVTVGIGCMLPTAESAVALAFAWPDRPATPAEIISCFESVKAMAPGHMASFYIRAPASLNLPDGAIASLAQHRLSGEFLPGLSRLCHDFGNFPESAQRALIDMAWNLGLGGLVKFHNLLGDVNSGRWRAAAIESHRSTCREERNQWTKNLFLQAAGEPVT